MSSLNAKLSLETTVSSYAFAGNCFGDVSGDILSDFPIPLNINNLAGTSLCEAARAILDISSNNYSAMATFRIQYGEPFLDKIVISKKISANTKIIDEIKELPIQLISESDPVVEMRKNNNVWQNLGVSEYSNNDVESFYFQPKNLKFSDFDFYSKSNVNFKEKFIIEYLNGLLPNVSYRLYEINPSFVNFMNMNHTGARGSNLRNTVYSKLHDIIEQSLIQGNKEVAKLVVDSSKDFDNKGFYLTGRIGEMREVNIFDKHYSPDKLIGMSDDVEIFPRTYILHAMPEGKQDKKNIEIIRVKESNSDYCVWLRDRQGFEKLLSHLVKL
jgi:hypothetical protein